MPRGIGRSVSATSFGATYGRFGWRAFARGRIVGLPPGGVRHAPPAPCRSLRGLLAPLAVLSLLVALASGARAQRPEQPRGLATTDGKPTLAAYRLASGASPRIDGRLDEEAWAEAPVASGFLQSEPAPGEPASETTEVRVLYDASAIYVGIRALVRDPSTLVRRLVRRDGFGDMSDRVFVEIGSPADGRTAFSFGVNLAGARQDVVLANDLNDGDATWDGVWDSAVRPFADASGASGYAVEIRIPLSQLRFDPANERPWEFNVQRDIAATGERTYWAPISPEADGYVSQFGLLTGLQGLRAPRRVEVVPYAATRLTRAPGEIGDPFYEVNDLSPVSGSMPSSGSPPASRSRRRPTPTSGRSRPTPPSSTCQPVRDLLRRAAAVLRRGHRGVRLRQHARARRARPAHLLLLPPHRRRAVVVQRDLRRHRLGLPPEWRRGVLDPRPGADHHPRRGQAERPGRPVDARPAQRRHLWRGRRLRRGERVSRQPARGASGELRRRPSAAPLARRADRRGRVRVVRHPRHAQRGLRSLPRLHGHGRRARRRDGHAEPGVDAERRRQRQRRHGQTRP